MLRHTRKPEIMEAIAKTPSAWVIYNSPTVVLEPNVRQLQGDIKRARRKLIYINKDDVPKACPAKQLDL
jgi:hypothetical protein